MTRRLNILFVTPSVSRKWGGTTTSVLSYYKAIAEIGHNVQVVTVYGESERPDIDASLLSNPDFHFYKVSFAPWRYSRAFSRYIRRTAGNFDIVHVHGMWTGVSFISARAAARHGVPYVITPHGMLEPAALRRKLIKKALYLRLIEKRLFAKASCVHCITEQEVRNVELAFRVKRTVQVPNGVYVPDFLHKPYQGLSDIAFIGRIHPIKGLDRLLEALAGIPRLNLVVAGAGDKDYERYIRGLIRRYDLKDRVKMVGFVDNDEKSAIFKNSLFTVIPSFSEGLSMVALESLANSTPVVVSRQCNFPEVGESGAGVVIENNETASIRQGIEQMLSADLARMSQNAHKLVTEKFGYRDVASALVEEYRKIIAAGE